MLCGRRTKQNGTPNFKTNLRYPVYRVIEWTRGELEAQITMACEFKQAAVEWFVYDPIRLDRNSGGIDFLVFQVEGRNKVPIPEDGNIEQLKDAIL